MNNEPKKGVEKMKITGGQSVVEVLRKESVKKIFGVPGESYLDVLDALYEDSDIEYISTRHEGGASFMAEAYAKASGKVGVCMATRGPGAANLSIGIHTARQDSTPLVALIGQVERPFRQREAFQEIDLASYFSPVCKWTVEIDRRERIPEMLHRAFHLARSGRPGPVLVSLPEDMLEERKEKGTHHPIPTQTVPPNEKLLMQVKQELLHAKRPVIIAGGGVTQSRAQSELVEIAEKLKIPVVTAFRRFTAFPNSHPNFIGTLGLGAPSYSLDYIKSADVVLALGTRLSQVTTNDYTLFHEDTRLIHVDISPAEHGKVYYPTLAITADTKEFAKELLSLIDPIESEERSQDLLELHKKYRDYSTPKKTYRTDYVDMDGLMYDFTRFIAKEAIITNDAGNFYSWLSRYYRYDDPVTCIGPTSGAMGYGLPAAIGAKLAHPKRQVISFSGDGGYMMTMQEFETAVRYDIPILAIVVNNRSYGTIRTHQEKKYPGRVIGTDLLNPNFAKVAENFGGYGERVKKNIEFIPAMKRALEAQKPALIEVMTDPEIFSANHAKK